MQESLSEQVSRVFELQRNHKTDQKNTSAKYRCSKLLKFRDLLISCESDIQVALEQDFAKAKLEVSLTEILPIVSMINFHIKNLKRWMKPKNSKFNPLFLGAKSYTSFEAKGNCLVLSPWNYPFNLSIYPVLTAFSAGNTVILKPSEYTPATNRVMKKLLSRVFSENEICVIEGEVEASTLLLDKKFDHIFFTGSTEVGKIVMKKASEHLASVSLELGGKSPTLLDKNYPIHLSAQKICWGKFVNAGQTCVAPDYILVESSQESELIEAIKKSLREHYGDNPMESEDYCQIISHKHGDRLQQMVEDAVGSGAKLHCGGKFDQETRKFEPTIISDLSEDSLLLKEEIFGPVLPIVRVKDLDEMIDYVNLRDNPLALYVFSNDSKISEKVRMQTTSGGYAVNEVLLHLAHTDLPFGGAGMSGIGRYHSHHGFEELSNQRAVLHRKFEFGLSIFQPPYSQSNIKILQFAFKYFRKFL